MTQVVIDIKEYEELQRYKVQVQDLINDQIRFIEEKTKELELKYKIKEQDIDLWIQGLNSKEWRIMFAGYSKSLKSIWPEEFTKTKVWQIVPVEKITWWLKWKTWIN